MWKKVKCFYVYIVDILVWGRGKNVVGAFAFDVFRTRRGVDVDGMFECWCRCVLGVVESRK